MKIRDISTVDNSYIALLARHSHQTSKYGVVYHDPVEDKLIQLVHWTVAGLFRQLILDVPFGLTIGAIVGLARERTPADAWHSDTIERNADDKNSLHRGILRIVEHEDGIPVFIGSKRLVSNIAPALTYLYKGNGVQTRQLLTRYNAIQKHMMTKILEGKPTEICQSSRAMYSGGEAFKSESRQRSIKRRLDRLVL